MTAIEISFSATGGLHSDYPDFAARNAHPVRVVLLAPIIPSAVPLDR